MKHKSNCKINLGLYVTEKRPDGFHNLETIFLPIPLFDEIEINISDELSFSQEGIALDCNPQKNLCIKAYELIKKNYPRIKAVQIHLRKNIPFGAGLGGGSSNAAETIKMLNELFSLKLTTKQMQYFASCLGSDCAFFIENKTAFAMGRGEILETLDINLENFSFMLKIPENEKISTAEAYKGITPAPAPVDLREAIKKPIKEWKNYIHNQFEDTIFPNHPKIAELKKQMYESGAIYASMSGSGACVYGIFEKQ